MWFAVPAAFSVRLALLVITQRAIDSADSIHYIAMAQQFAAGDFLSFDENLPVLYPLLGALVHLVVSDWEWAFWIVSLTASSLTVIPVYWLSRELHGDRAARVMALMICLWPWLVDYGSRIQPEALSVCLWFASVWFVYRAVVTGGRYLAFASLALFALHLARPEGTLLLLAAPLGALLLCYRAEGARFRRVVGLAAVVGFVALTYMLAMRALIGTATISYRAPMVDDVPDYFRRGAVDFAKTFLQVTFNALPLMLGPVLPIFIGLGIFSRPETRRGFGLEALVLFFCLIQYAATLANFSPSPRYIMPIVVACGLWAAWGVVRARDIIAGAGYRRFAAVPILAVAGTFTLGVVVGFAADRLGSIPQTPIEYRLVGHWMRDHLEPGLILTRKPQVGFYAGMPTTGPDASDDVAALMERAEDSGARYVVIDERYTASMAPGIASLLDSGNAPPHLELLRDDLSAWAGAKVVIYEMKIPGMVYLAPEAFPRPDSHMGPDERRRKGASSENP